MTDMTFGSQRLVARPLSWDEFVGAIKRDAARFFGPDKEEGLPERQLMPTYYVEAQPNWFLEKRTDFAVLNNAPVMVLDRLRELLAQIEEPIPYISIRSTWGMQNLHENTNSLRMGLNSLNAMVPTKHHPHASGVRPNGKPRAVAKIESDFLSLKLESLNLKVTARDGNYEIASFRRGVTQEQLYQDGLGEALTWFCVYERKMIKYDLPSHMTAQDETTLV